MEDTEHWLKLWLHIRIEPWRKSGTIASLSLREPSSKGILRPKSELFQETHLYKGQIKCLIIVVMLPFMIGHIHSSHLYHDKYTSQAHSLDISTRDIARELLQNNRQLGEYIILNKAGALRTNQPKPTRYPATGVSAHPYSN